jgi:hypothetical protein
MSVRGRLSRLCRRARGTTKYVGEEELENRDGRERLRVPDHRSVCISITSAPPRHLLYTSGGGGIL